jgi:hypothetical protein
MSINLTQRFLYETDSLGSFETVLDAMVRVMYEEQPSKYSQMFVTRNQGLFGDGRKWIGPREMSAINPKGWSRPQFLHVCSISDYKSNIREGDDAFRSYENLVQTVMMHLRNADTEEFFRQCGDGYDDMFNECDGSVDVGYRLTQRSLCGWNYLDVSLCHVYYGK